MFWFQVSGFVFIRVVLLYLLLIWIQYDDYLLLIWFSLHQFIRLNLDLITITMAIVTMTIVLDIMLIVWLILFFLQYNFAILFLPRLIVYTLTSQHRQSLLHILIYILLCLKLWFIHYWFLQLTYILLLWALLRNLRA